MLTYDQRLSFINKIDFQVWQNCNQVKPAESEKFKQESQLPIVMHEREIMENIDNFLVTIVCGETGSGKST
jgi:HrpA-like RNA helicase